MASERTQRRIDSLLDEAEEAIAQLDWQVVRSRAQAVTALDPANLDAINYLAAAERALGATPDSASPTPQADTTPKEPPVTKWRGEEEEIMDNSQRQTQYNMGSLPSRATTR